jgi:PPOX class probable F420-dependent enzyme
MAVLTEKQRSFIRDNPFPAVLTTLRKDGTPHSTVVWIDEDGGDILFNTAEGRAKPRELADDPRVSVTFVDPSDMYKWISISGRAELTTEGARETIDKLAKKYLGKDEYPWYQGEQRIDVRIKPEKIDSYGLDD